MNSASDFIARSIVLAYEVLASNIIVDFVSCFNYKHTLIRWNSPTSNIMDLPEGSSFGTLDTKVNKNISFLFNSLFVSSKVM